MTVSAQTTVNSSAGNGATTVFPYTFKILRDADLEVLVDGVVKTLTTDYTVSGAGVDAGGDVTFVTAPATSTTVVRRRNMQFLRSADYQYQGDLPNTVLNPDLDAPVMMAQQLQEQVDRSVRGPAGEEWTELEAAADRLDKFLVFDATTGLPELSTFTQTQVASAVAAAYAAGSTADAVTFTPAGTGAVARSVQAKLRGIAVDVSDFGAALDGVTDDTAAWLAARTELQTQGGGSIIGAAGKSTVITAQVVFTSDDCYIDCPGMTVIPSGSTNMDGVFKWSGGGVQATPVLGTNAARGARSISVSTLGGLAAGSWMRISKTTTDGGSTYYYQTRVRSVSGAGPWTVNMEGALPIAFATADAGLEIKRVTVVSGGGFLSPVAFDGSVSTATTLHAVASDWQVCGAFHHISGSDFDAGAVLYATNGHGNAFDDLYAYNSGTASFSDVHFIAQTGAVFTRHRSLNAAGFGPQYSGGSYCSISDIVSEGAQGGRAVKINALLNCMAANLQGHGASTTGVSITNGCKYNSFANFSGNGNLNAEGVWFSNQNNTENALHGVSGYGNTSYDLYIGATDTGNSISGCVAVGTYYINNALTYWGGINNSTPASGTQAAQSSVDNIATSGATVTVGAVTTETTLATITVPANRMGINGRVRVRGQFVLNSSADAKTVRVKFGGTTMQTVAKTTETLLEIDCIVYNSNNASAQSVIAKSLTGGGTSTLTQTTAAIATTSDVTVLITGQKAVAGDTLQMIHYSAELVKA